MGRDLREKHHVHSVKFFIVSASSLLPDDFASCGPVPAHPDEKPGHSLILAPSETLLELWLFRWSGKYPWNSQEFL